ncbi:uncharacterized protein LOC131998493 [Stomoxys calcitrans]|uniref:uncharacterized protein LOC131998493 n=1 Tax=Stomoxys calcitrans TaxID=35570 RepID=UPI0027E3750B|nr:uncharacterized protein LOC131998493 [Stomoxys calcitrans]
MNSSEKLKWIDAMKNEIKSLEKNNTWILVEKPPRVNVIKTKWVTKDKKEPGGCVCSFLITSFHAVPDRTFLTMLKRVRLLLQQDNDPKLCSLPTTLVYLTRWMNAYHLQQRDQFGY